MKTRLMKLLSIRGGGDSNSKEMEALDLLQCLVS